MIEIREIRPDEHAATGDVTVDGYRSFYREELGDYAERLRDVDSRARDAVVLVAVDDGEVLGTVTYVPDTGSAFAQKQQEGEASIRMLAVSPQHQNRGIGRMLSVACIARARADGKRAVVLHADEAMNVSRRLYERLGFRRDPSRDWRPDEQTLLVCYVLDLSATVTEPRTSRS